MPRPSRRGGTASSEQSGRWLSSGWPGAVGGSRCDTDPGPVTGGSCQWSASPGWCWPSRRRSARSRATWPTCRVVVCSGMVNGCSHPGACSSRSESAWPYRSSCGRPGAEPRPPSCCCRSQCCPPSPGDWLAGWIRWATPQTVSQVVERLAADPRPGAVLLLPFQTYRQFAWNGGQTSLDPLPRLLPRTVISSSDLPVRVAGQRVVVPGEDRLARAASAALASPDPAAGLAALGVRWVVRDAPATSAVAGSRVVFAGPNLTLDELASPDPARAQRPGGTRGSTPVGRAHGRCPVGLCGRRRDGRGGGKSAGSAATVR